MQPALEFLDVVSGNGHLFFFELVHSKEQGAVILCLDFVNSGKIDDVAFMGAEET